MANSFWYQVFSVEDKENKIFKEIEATFSEEQFGPTTNGYKKALEIEWCITNDKFFF